MTLSTLGLLLAVTLPTGWKIEPVGVRMDLDTFPIHAQRLGDGKRALVLHSGFRPPSIEVLDVTTGARSGTLKLKEAGLNFAFDESSGEIFVPGGHESKMYLLRLEGSRIVEAGSVALNDPTGPVSSVALSAKLVAITQTTQDRVGVYDRASRGLKYLSVPRPMRAAFHEGLLYVLSNQPAALHVFSTELKPLAQVPLSDGPADLLVHAGKLFVSASSTNYLDVLDVRVASAPKRVERINLAPQARWPVGMTPATLSLDEVWGRLYVTCSDANAVAVLNVESGKLEGYLPTGWYPTYALPLGRESVLILNGKGERSYPNPKGPNPTVHRTMTPQPPSEIEYTPLIQTGTARRIDNAAKRFAKIEARPVAPQRGSLPKQIEHVIYIMKENRTYDQVLGDLKEGNGDASLCLFPERITPNHHQLAREFVLLDNFYVNADVSSEGWHWTSAAIVPYGLARRWPAAYAGRARGGGANDEDAPPGGYLWSAALKQGLSVRNYGFFVRNRPGAKPGEVVAAGTSDPALMAHTNPYYAGYDPDFPDVERARIFLEDLKEFERRGEMPKLIVMVLPNDHTWGTSPGKLTPFASMADNDLALGRIVEAVSKSRFWPKTAIFVLEDDAQNGPDHVDSHRSPAFVISPYTRQRRTDSTFYNTTSMLHTIEALLGLPAMTHYDASSKAMRSVFGKKADLSDYEAVVNGVPLDTKNPPRPGVVAMDFSQPDRVEDDVLNEVLWRAIRGGSAPARTRAGHGVP